MYGSLGVQALKHFARFTWFLLAYTLCVILWGAFVRATGSGAGCGSHWPLCNGEVIPRAATLETLIEFTHRLSSGLLGAFVLVALVWAYRLYPRRHLVRALVLGVVLLVLSEALIGAGIVRFEWVAENVSIARLLTMAFHLLNTFFLVAVMTALCWVVANDFHGPLPRLESHSLLALIAVLVVGMSGAVIALGDTLVLGAGLNPEDSPLLARIVAARWTHPGLAIAAFATTGLASWRQYARHLPSVHPVPLRTARWAVGLFALQLALGGVNVWLRAPVTIQLAHLLLSDLIWICLVLSALGYAAAAAAPVRGDFEPRHERMA